MTGHKRVWEKWIFFTLQRKSEENIIYFNCCLTCKLRFMPIEGFPPGGSGWGYGHARTCVCEHVLIVTAGEWGNKIRERAIRNAGEHLKPCLPAFALLPSNHNNDSALAVPLLRVWLCVSYRLSSIHQVVCLPVWLSRFHVISCDCCNIVRYYQALHGSPVQWQHLFLTTDVGQVLNHTEKLYTQIAVIWSATL